MSRLSLAFVLLVGISVGVWIYGGQMEDSPEGALLGLGAEVEASADAEDSAEQEADADLRTPVPSDSTDEERGSLADGALETQEIEAPDSVTSPEVDELADWTGPWPKYAESARRQVLDRESTLDEKGSAFKSLQAFNSGDGEDPRTEDVLREAVWILDHTSDAGVLDDVLDGIEGTRFPALIDPVIAVLINHESAKVRSGAVSVLGFYEGNERVEVALEHAAQYDENERVREKASAAIEG